MILLNGIYVIFNFRYRVKRDQHIHFSFVVRLKIRYIESAHTISKQPTKFNKVSSFLFCDILSQKYFSQLHKNQQLEMSWVRNGRLSAAIFVRDTEVDFWYEYVEYDWNVS